MSDGIVLCSKCSRMVFQIREGDMINGKLKWIHLLDRTPICIGAVAMYPSFSTTGTCEHGFCDWCPYGCFAGHRGR